MNPALFVRIRFGRQQAESRRWSVGATISVFHNNNCVDLVKIDGQSQVIKKRIVPVLFATHHTERRTGEDYVIILFTFHLL